MSAALVAVVPSWPKAWGVALVIVAASFGATPAFAAPELAISMTQQNPYGAEGTVDPHTGSGATFARESGYDAYTITVTNVGDSATNGAISVADELPEGLAPIRSNFQENGYIAGEAENGWSFCDIALLTCTNATPLAPGESSSPLTLHVHVEQTAADSLTNRATVYGGGATASTTASETTVVAPAVPFGIEDFATSVTDAKGDPFTQAGGHPFSATTSIQFNSTTSDEEGEQGGSVLRTAGGSPRDLEVDLPPGFIGNPQAAPKCPIRLLSAFFGSNCPVSTGVGYVAVAFRGTPASGPEFTRANSGEVYNLQPPPGQAAAFGFNLVGGKKFILDGKVRSDGDYGLTVGDSATGIPTPLAIKLTFCDGGVEGSLFAGFDCVATGSSPFLTTPTVCAGKAPTTTLRADSYQAPEDYVSLTAYNGSHFDDASPSLSESFLNGCNGLTFEPTVEFGPAGSEGGTTQADEPTGATFDLRVPQAKEEAGVDATPELKNATVTLPEGMTVDPSAADGLQACNDTQFGLGSTVEPTEPAACPLASQIGTVKVLTPLLEKPLEGQVFLGEPECSPCSNSDAEAGRIFRLFLQVRSVERGVIVKLAGRMTANPATGRLQATFSQQPQLPFSELQLTLNGGARASLANPQTCGTFTTTTDLTPWSAPGLGGLSGNEPIAGTPDATPSSSFNVDWNGAGGACPATMPFSPSFSAGSQTPTAGASSSFSVTVGREDREQDLSGITVSTPPGLLGKIAGIPQCSEAQANAGTCGPESQIGTTTVGAGPGPHPFYLGGTVYLTGPYKGQPFGLSIVTPAVAGPFNLGTVVVRAAIAVNPSTAALTIVSDPLPQFVDGVQLRLRSIHVEVNRPGFMLNPTSCAAQGVGASITGVQGASVSVSSPFEVGGCQSLPFSPSLSASTQGSTSKAKGASLTITVKSVPGQANIGKVDVQLPKALPARLIPTLQNACTEAQFNTNPAGCPADSFVGAATAVTPILNAPLSGPAILVSHGGAAFPDLEFLLQGENGVEIVLDGKTDIKGGITYSKFESVPDAPISSFVTTLPEGPHSILAAPSGNLCGKSLVMGTTITAQNGKQIIQKTKITVTDCSKAKVKALTRAQKLKRALHACRTRYKKRRLKRLTCEKQTRKRYGPIKKARKTNRRGK